MGSDSEGCRVEFLHYCRRAEGAASDLDFLVAFVEDLLEQVLAVHCCAVLLYQVGPVLS